MVDGCEIREPSTFGELDPATGLKPETLGAVAYSGKCKVQTFEAHESTPDSGGHQFTVQRYSVHVPATAQVDVDYMVAVTSAALDANLVGRRYRVAGFLHKTFATANRLQVEEVTG